MPRKKNRAAQPIGRGKKGTGKRMISASGGGKKTLAAWRSIPKGSRQAIRKTARTTGESLTGIVRSIKTQRSARGASPMTGLKRGFSVNGAETPVRALRGVLAEFDKRMREAREQR